MSAENPVPLTAEELDALPVGARVRSMGKVPRYLLPDTVFVRVARSPWPDQSAWTPACGEHATFGSQRLTEFRVVQLDGLADTVKPKTLAEEHS